jgi:simple sugar transport system permease protein
VTDPVGAVVESTEPPLAPDAATPKPWLSRRARGALVERLWPMLGVVASLAFLAPLLAIAGADIGKGYRALFSASFGASYGVGFLFLTSVPLVLVGLGVAIPYRAGLFNIGGEGQLLVGAIAAVALATHLPGGVGTPVSFLLPLLVALPAGAALGATAGILKAWRGINEIVTTIMLSFLAIYLVQYLIRKPLQGASLVYPATDQVPTGYRLGTFGSGGIVPVGIIVAVVAVVAAWIMTEFTRVGWRQRLIGLNAALARRQGIGVGGEQVLALALGGALAGLGGGAEALGNQFRVGLAFSPGWGFDAVAIALLARGNALAVLPFALYFGFLRNGANVLQTDLEISPDLVLILGAAPVILVAAVIGYRAYKRAVAEPPDD